MAIDPDVQVEIDRLDSRLDTVADDLESHSHGEVSCGCVDAVFDPGNFSAAAVNEAADDLYKYKRGGRIRIDGAHVDLLQEAPIVARPGVEIFGTGVPSVTEQVRTLLVPTFSNAPQLVQTPLTHNGQFRSWGASSFHHLTVRNKRNNPGLRVLDVEGGNHSRVHDISQQGNGFEYGLHFVDLRGKADGQYSYYDHINIYGAKYPLYVDRSCPDVKLSQSMFYGKNKGGSSGPEPGSELYLGSEAWELTNVTSQFTDIGWHLDNVHIQILGGAQEMYVRWSDTGNTKASTVFKLGPRARDIVVIAHSLANINSAKRVLDVVGSPSFASFRDLPQLRPNDIPNEYHKWFTFIQR